MTRTQLQALFIYDATSEVSEAQQYATFLEDKALKYKGINTGLKAAQLKGNGA